MDGTMGSEAALLINDYFPEILVDMPDLKENMSFYKLMHAAVLFTTKKIKVRDFASVKTCMNAIEKLHEQGNNGAKRAIENIYVYALTNLTYWLDRPDKIHVQSIIPPTLKQLYIDQLRHSFLP